MTYRNFALIYDDVMSHAPYDDWVSFTLEVIRTNQKEIKTILDLGCGTGEIAVRLAKQGYHLYGVDYSNEMLSVAMDKSINHNVSVQWIQQDIRELTGFDQVDLATSYCDVLNYVTTEEDLLATFQAVYNSLSDGGRFIFDIHGQHYAKTQLLNNSFSSREQDIAYIWDCEPGESDGELIHLLSFFVQDEVGLYERFDEIHKQHIFATETYERLLTKAKFINLKFYQDFSLENEFSPEEAKRIFIVAEKKVR